MTLDEQILAEAKEVRQHLIDLESQTAHARVDYHHAIKKLNAAGGSLREIAEALELSHQRVHQIVDGPAGPHGPPPGPGAAGGTGAVTGAAAASSSWPASTTTPRGDRRGADGGRLPEAHVPRHRASDARDRQARRRGVDLRGGRATDRRAHRRGRRAVDRGHARPVHAAGEARPRVGPERSLGRRPRAVRAGRHPGGARLGSARSGGEVLRSLGLTAEQLRAKLST